MRRILSLFFSVLVALSIPVLAFAHPGRTDASGGHTDHSSGEYHYHHGYPAHQHSDTDGDGIPDCPYLESSSTASSAPAATLPTVPLQSIISASLPPTTSKSSASIALPASSVSTSVSLAKAGTSGSDSGNIFTYSLLIVFALLLTFSYVAHISNKHERETAELERKIRNQSNEILQLRKKLEYTEATLHSTESKLHSVVLSEAKAVEDKKHLESNFAELTSKFVNIGALIGDETARKAEAMSTRRLPVGIVFENGVPVKGVRTEEKPYGDYTVYVSRNSKKYHKSIGCSNSWKSTMHLYSLPGNYAPCCICHPLPLPSEEDRQWYRDIVNAYYLLNKNKSV